MSGPEFDAYAERYDEDLARGLSLTGEDKDYYARGRVAWLARRLAALEVRPNRVLDFGCGTGTSLPLLHSVLGAALVVGMDPSEASLEQARRRWGGDSVRLIAPDALGDEAPFDLAFTNGVFHHIPPEERDRALRSIAAALAPGGWLALWENNPWNPGTRWIMRRVAFDRDAILLTVGECRRRLAAAGLRVARVDHCFIFPSALRLLRGLEAPLAGLPLGGQYLVLARKVR
ncbi:MAG: methyltransferase domain-containing protein [Gemmatimonadales bacterium]